MRFLITGGAGFIGSNTAAALVANGDGVVVLDDFSTGRSENLAGLEGRIEIVRGDIRSEEILGRALALEPDFILHQAALPSVQRSMENPLESHTVNVDGTLGLLLAARRAGVRRVVIASSSSVYGDSEELPKVETMGPNPISPYAVTKLSVELYSRIFTGSFGIEVVCLRYFNVFGPRQDPGSEYSAVIPKFIIAMMRGQSPTIYGDGRQSRDFSYIDNVISANLLACRAEGAAGRVFNVACGESYTLLDLVDSLNELLDRRLEPRFAEARDGDVRHSLAGIDHARQVLGYEPLIGFREGLERTVEWYRKA